MFSRLAAISLIRGTQARPLRGTRAAVYSLTSAAGMAVRPQYGEGYIPWTTVGSHSLNTRS